jgi:hypothetical protein
MTKINLTLVAFARCMRAHGVAEFPEPAEGRLLIRGGDQNGQYFGPPGSKGVALALPRGGPGGPGGGVASSQESKAAP